MDKTTELKKKISDLEELLANAEDSGWCLGDPYEALDSLKHQLDQETAQREKACDE